MARIELPTKSIVLNETSYDVAILHKVLAALGHPVAREEVKENRAGPYTREKVRALQKELNVPVDESTVVDPATMTAIIGVMDKQGLLAGSRAHTVKGTVRLPDGSPKKRQRVIAFDLDLRGVAVYRTAKTISECINQGGFEFLGQAVSDSQGNYSLTFYDWQYRRAERKMADVIVYAIEESKKDLKIIGLSRLIGITDYSAKGDINGLDVLLSGNDERTEYEILMALLNPFLDESSMKFRDISSSPDQLGFAARELEIDLSHLNIAAQAEILIAEQRTKLSHKLLHELLYGIGRQGIALKWEVLGKKTPNEIRRSISKSVAQHIIQARSDSDVSAFLSALARMAAKGILGTKVQGSNQVAELLANVLPDESKRDAFVQAIASFEGKDFRDFWSKHVPSLPEFRDKPELVQRVLLGQQITMLVGNHQPMVGELIEARKIGSVAELFELGENDWRDIVMKAGVPEQIQADTEEERAAVYIDQIQTGLNAAFPTQRIAQMVRTNTIPTVPAETTLALTKFLSGNPHFDFRTSRVFDFEKELTAAGGAKADDLKKELLKIQRVFQVSTTPAAMQILLQDDLHSARAIASTPRKSFLKTYGKKLGGGKEAFLIHQRASFIAERSEHAAMRMNEYSNGFTPPYVMGDAESAQAMIVMDDHVPNYSELFGSPDICECEQCRSVYSASAYLVDLLRFLAGGSPNAEGKTPLDVLAERRPDLLHLPLTCENTNTLIPYIDLANEVMEYYVVNDSIAAFPAYDTGQATADELRADPQNFDLEAYRKLKDAKFPFNLPYHQPLDVIRTYGGKLKVSRYEAMSATNPAPDATTGKAIAAENLRLSQEDYEVLTGEAFDGSPSSASLPEYYGYTNTGELENLSHVAEFLSRSGVQYTELVELVKTQFINPHQPALEFLQELFTYATVDAVTLYGKLAQIKAGTLSPATDAAIIGSLTAYNAARGTSIGPADFGSWVSDNFDAFQQVITLFEPDSKCDLATTRLRTIQSIYEGSTTSGMAPYWPKIHRFIRLWRKLGWSIHETDLMLAALGQEDITHESIDHLSYVASLRSATKLPLDKLAVLWGTIDSYGEKSLYANLFLRKVNKAIDPLFRTDAWGHYFEASPTVLSDPAARSGLLAAFRIRDDDLAAILDVAQLVDNGSTRKIDPITDELNFATLSTIYRHVVLAKALKLHITDLCTLISLFGPAPFSTWDLQLKQYVDISPKDTWSFYQTASAAQNAGFKASTLAYIFDGTVMPKSRIELDQTKALQAGKIIHDSFAEIEQIHPDSPLFPLTTDILASKLALTFQVDVVSRFVEILDGTALFSTLTDMNLSVVIPESLSSKYSYIKGSGRLMGMGVMTDDDQTALKALSGATPAFQSAVDVLHDAPDKFISANFDGVLTDLTEAHAVLLDHPKQATAATLEEKLAYVYGLFIPVLKKKLRRDVVVRNIAALIGTTDESAALLAVGKMENLIADLSAGGFSGGYFSDASWTTAVQSRTDSAIDFAWGAGSPDTTVPADSFSVRWQAYIAPPASGTYTFVVDVNGADESFRLYLDEVLIGEKVSGDTNTSLEFEVSTPLNASQLYLLKLEYTEAAQDASIRLCWKTATSALTVIPDTISYPFEGMGSFVNQVNIYHRAAKFVSGFKLTETELDCFIRHGSDFGALDFEAITPEAWKRIADYVNLRNAVPQARALLTDVFELVGTIDPLPTLGDVKTVLYDATGWDSANMDFLIDTHLSLVLSDFKNEIVLNQLFGILRIAGRTGLSAEVITRWGTVDTDFDSLNDTAKLIRNAVKARYPESDWLALAGQLSDILRENQRQSLVAYLLTRPLIQSAGVSDADGLYEYFLIDVLMSSCMDTSRIVQANGAIQMFINRCLLNLEDGVSPDAIDKDRWDWMKYYRVHEAGLKVFLYPENLLEPEWRMDRSEFFKELESYLVQNDITDRSVEQGFRAYLSNLNEVANLEVCGQLRETNKNGELIRLHVFARSPNSPYKYFHRTWSKYRKWSAWQKIPGDIQGVENGARSGVHLVPVFWKNRIFLFWPMFTVRHDTSSNDGQTPRESADSTSATLQGFKYWEVRLAWSEFVDGKWSPKQISKDFIKQEYWHYIPDEASIRFASEIDDDNNLAIYLVINFAGESDPRDWYVDGAFLLTDISSIVVANSGGWGHAHESWNPDYETNYMNVSAYSDLELLGNTYLRSEFQHDLLLSPETTNFTPDFKSPFFYTGDVRTYFVRPVDISWLEYVREPDRFRPIISIWLDDGMQLPGNDTQIGTAPLPGIVGMGAGTAYEFRAGRQPSGSSSSSAVTDARIPDAGVRNSRNMLFAREKAKGGYMSDMIATPPAFGVARDRDFATFGIAFRHWDTGLEFDTFHHPYSSTYVGNLNHGGFDELMESDTTLPSDDGTTFETVYDPNFTHGLVQKPDDFAQHTYFKENVCFDVYGANSIYNWELFYHAPLYIATRLSRNGRYEEAMRWFHFIFDPTTDVGSGPGETGTPRYWKVLPFKTTPAQSLDDWFRNTAAGTKKEIIEEWRDNPFDPFMVASNRPIAFMKSVVIKYVENLIDWGDSLFRQFTRESVNEALQLYVIASHILGPKPQFVPRRGTVKAESYFSLKDKWDDLSNALVVLENIFPYSSDAPVSSSSSGPNLLGAGKDWYFCIPANEKLVKYWDTVADRLFKIRHCRDIDGVERSLALFAPPIDPAALVQAAAQGLSLGSILADLSSPPPLYRFTYLIEKANEFCVDVKNLGSALLAALEKKDAEHLARLRASHETQMLELITSTKERQLLEARAAKEALQKARAVSDFRLRHYLGMLNNTTIQMPSEPTISEDLNADSPLPADTSIPRVIAAVDTAPVRDSDSGVTLISREKSEIDDLGTARIYQAGAQGAEALAGIFHLLPDFGILGSPLGVGGNTKFPTGQKIADASSALGKVSAFVAGFYSHTALMAQKMASYVRREQDWTLQANLAAKEIVHIDKQITSADIRIQIAKKELDNHLEQIDQAKEIELYLTDKFSNEELYQWMKEQLFSVFKQGYNVAFEMAKKAEKAYKYETGQEHASFVQYGNWDNSRLGLVSGEKLQLSLRQMEKSYLEGNHREFELSKNISLAQINPTALLELCETGQCRFSLPEELFDLDFRGHYFRRIKSVRLTIPCVAGPYSSVNCTLRLLSNTYRKNTALNSSGNYEHENDEGVWTDDDRFHSNHVPVTAIATSSAQMDSGMFEFNFRDERYLPFEHAGAISEWSLELSTEKEFRQFDYNTISDVILHLDYTAREDTGLFKNKAAVHLTEFVANSADISGQPLVSMLQMKHSFSNEWYRFFHPGTSGGEQVLRFRIGRERLPFFVQDREVVVEGIQLIVKSNAASQPYTAVLSYIPKTDSVAVTSTEIALPTDYPFPGTNGATLGVNDASMNLEDLDIEKEITIKIKKNTASDYASLTTNPDELYDLFLVIHYKLGSA